MPSNKRARTTTISKNSNSLAILVLDVSPAAWGERDVKRKALDRARQAAGKSSMGPAILEDVLQSVTALCNCIATLERSASLVILAVADNECAIVFPRKNQLAAWLQGGAVGDGYTPHTQQLPQLVHDGVAQLLARVVSKGSTDPATRQAAMAAGFSQALCLLNRLLVAARAGGVSALQQAHYMDRIDDQGVVALMDGNGDQNNNASTVEPGAGTAWSPRILLVQASEDRSRDFNAFMNCAFAAKKDNITVDGCFLTAATSSKDKNIATSSRFLEQVCDLTGGVFSAPSGMAQMGGALTEVLLSVFLPPIPCRTALHLPALNKVDFRAKCFESGSAVDQAFVCNLCLSIFQRAPKEYCPTCGARIVERVVAP